MEKEELLERYEAYGHESDYAEARRLYEQALAEGAADARSLNGFGYLQEGHGRRDLRAAAECYERAIEADPQWPKPHWQLILALSTLGENDRLVERYRQRLDAAPTDPLAHAFLASAYLYARDYDDASEVIRAGLWLAPDDARLTELRGDVSAATGRPHDALADWQRAHVLDPDNLGSRYSSAFLLERLGRLADAAGEWRFIVVWNEERGYDMTVDWPRRELRRLESMRP
jgi:tetratricopeptide (TPR) repeat protein